MAAIAQVRFVRGNLNGILAKVAGGLFEGVTEAAALIEASAKEKCPVDTGDLQASISTEVSRGIQNIRKGGAIASTMFGVSARIAPHTDYAAYVEFGTGQRGASSPGAGEGPYKPDWPGMAAQPYMRPALDEQRGNAEDAIKSAVRDALS